MSSPIAAEDFFCSRSIPVGESGQLYSFDKLNQKWRGFLPVITILFDTHKQNRNVHYTNS